MKTNKTYFVIAILLVITFIFSGCGIVPSQPKGTISGQVLVPPGDSEMSKDISGWVPAAGAEVTIVDANGVTQTVITDENGYYTFENVAVNPNTVITATATVDGKTIVLKGVIPQAVAADEDYDAGTMDPETTALALVVEELIDEGVEPVDINLAEVQASETFTDLVEQVSEVLEEQGNVTEDPDVIDGAGDTADEILNPPAPPSPPSGPSTVSVTSVSIEQEDQILIVGNTLDLTATFEPANATNKNVNWTSDKNDVATVSVEGSVTAVAEGVAVITVTTEDGEKSDTITITVSKIYNQTQKTSHNTIQDAIDTATAGDTILVGAGLYKEQLEIDRSIILSGPNTGISGDSTRVDEAIITYPEGTDTTDLHLVYATADDVIIDGFSFINEQETEDHEIRELWFLGVNNEFINNRVIVYSDKMPVHFGFNEQESMAKGGIVVRNNYIESTSSWATLYLQGRAGTVEDNTINGGIMAIQIQPYSNSVDGLVRNNILSGYDTVIWHNFAKKGSGTWTYDNNSLSAHLPMNTYRWLDRYWRGLTIQTHGSVGSGADPHLVFTNNMINGSGASVGTTWDEVIGIHFRAGGISDTATYEFTNNSISDVSIGVFKAVGAIDLEEMLSDNFFPDGSQVIGDKIIVPETGTVYNKRTGDEYSTIQGAVDGATDEDTILLATGTYKE
ncbi:MAG: Ig-like domain-containing protein, partial [Atribacterota bacterium]|nr:Ig-like domain-containing protein [Atribacterota bacterium]